MVRKIYVKSILNTDQLNKIRGKKLPTGYFKNIIRNEDVDIIKEDGSYLLRLRKNVFSKNDTKNFYDNIIEHARKFTTTRGTVSGQNKKKEKMLVTTNKKIQSNIIGFFDTLSVRQKWVLNQANIPTQNRPICRESYFNINYPLKWNKILPFIQKIDKMYQKLFPKEWKKQFNEANKINYRIPKTSFTTLTTNLNLQTAVHTDKGDYQEGFGNLVVFEKGKYKGGITGFPKYGVAIDLREGDFLGMNVHELHGNEPIIPITKDAERLSIVSYLREGIVRKCNGLPLIPKDYFQNPKKYKNKKFTKKNNKNFNKTKKCKFKNTRKNHNS